MPFDIYGVNQKNSCFFCGDGCEEQGGYCDPCADYEREREEQLIAEEEAGRYPQYPEPPGQYDWQNCEDPQIVPTFDGEDRIYATMVANYGGTMVRFTSDLPDQENPVCVELMVYQSQGCPLEMKSMTPEQCIVLDRFLQCLSASDPATQETDVLFRTYENEDKVARFTIPDVCEFSWNPHFDGIVALSPLGDTEGRRRIYVSANETRSFLVSPKPEKVVEQAVQPVHDSGISR